MKENGTKIESVLKKKYFEQTYKLRVKRTKWGYVKSILNVDENLKL